MLHVSISKNRMFNWCSVTMLKFVFPCKMKRERFRKAMKLAKNGNIANWGGTHSYSHAGQVQSLTSTVNQILVTLISATSLLQCMMHNGAEVKFSLKIQQTIFIKYDELLGRTTHRPSVWCSKYYSFFFVISWKVSIYFLIFL